MECNIPWLWMAKKLGFQTKEEKGSQMAMQQS
jgi:hypothetical protein